MNEQLRIGDADRERAAAILGEHYVAGRLTAEEHAERLDAVWSARTRGDLDDLFHDLPRVEPARTVAPAARALAPACRRGPRAWLPLAVLGLVALIVLTPLRPPILVLAIVLLVVFARRRRWAAHHGWPTHHRGPAH